VCVCLLVDNGLIKCIAMERCWYSAQHNLPVVFVYPYIRGQY